MKSKIKTLFYFIVVAFGVFTVLYLLDDLKSFYIFQARDMARARDILVGHMHWLGPEMSRRGHLPGPAAYLLDAIPLYFFKTWQSVYYFSTLLVSLSTGYFVLGLWKRVGRKAAAIGLILYMATPIGLMAALMNAHPVYLVALNPLILFPLWDYYGDEKKSNKNLFTSFFLIGLGLQFHFSALFWLMAASVLQIFSDRKRIHFFAAFLFFLIPSIPTLIVHPVSEVFAAGEFALRAENMREFFDFMIHFPAGLILFGILVFLEVRLRHRSSMREIKAQVILAAIAFAVFLAVFAGKTFEARYFIVINFVAIATLAVYCERILSIDRNHIWPKYAATLIFVFAMVIPVVLLQRDEHKGCTETDYAAQDLTDAAALSEISKIIKENTSWSYDDFLSRTVLIGYDEVNVGFRPIFEGVKAKKNNLNVNGLILLDRALLCRSPEQNYESLLPADLKKHFSAGEYKKAAEFQVRNTYLFFYEIKSESPVKSELQNVGYAYEELKNLDVDERLKYEKSPDDFKKTWNDCDDGSRDCDVFFTAKINKAADHCRLDYRLYGKLLSYNESLYSSGAVGYYENIELLTDARKQVLLLSLGYNPENRQAFLRAPISDSLIWPCSIRPEKLQLNIGGGGLFQVDANGRKSLWRKTEYRSFEVSR